MTDKASRPDGSVSGEGLGAGCQGDRVRRAFIEVTEKPRLIKSGAGWICVGMVRPRWWRFWAEPAIITWHGDNPWIAWHGWTFAARDSA